MTIMAEFPPYACGSRSPFWWWCVPSPAQTPRGEPFCPHLCTWPPALALGDVHWFISPGPGSCFAFCCMNQQMHDVLSISGACLLSAAVNTHTPRL